MNDDAQKEVFFLSLHSREFLPCFLVLKMKIMMIRSSATTPNTLIGTKMKTSTRRKESPVEKKNLILQKHEFYLKTD